VGGSKPFRPSPAEMLRQVIERPMIITSGTASMGAVPRLTRERPAASAPHKAGYYEDKVISPSPAVFPTDRTGNISDAVMLDEPEIFAPRRGSAAPQAWKPPCRCRLK